MNLLSNSEKSSYFCLSSLVLNADFCTFGSVRETKEF